MVGQVAPVNALLADNVFNSGAPSAGAQTQMLTAHVPGVRASAWGRFLPVTKVRSRPTPVARLRRPFLQQADIQNAYRGSAQPGEHVSPQSRSGESANRARRVVALTSLDFRLRSPSDGDEPTPD